MSDSSKELIIAAVIEIAKRENNEDFVSSNSLAATLGTSPRRFDVALQNLVSAKVLVSSRGLKGGYKLSQSPDKILLSQIVYSIRSRVVKVAARHPSQHKARLMLEPAQAAYYDYLSSVTLADCLGGMGAQRVKKMAETRMSR